MTSLYQDIFRLTAGACFSGMALGAVLMWNPSTGTSGWEPTAAAAPMHQSPKCDNLKDWKFSKSQQCHLPQGF